MSDDYGLQPCRMTLGNLIDQVRSHYVTRLVDAIHEAGREKRLIAEGVLRDSFGAPVRDGTLGLPVRVDLLIFNRDVPLAVKRIETMHIVSFSPITTTWENSLATRIAPFRWEACEIRMIGALHGAPWTPLVDWFRRWFDEADASEPDEDGLYGVIHFLSEPKTEFGKVAFSIDFGSAPVEAFEELLDVAMQLGAGSAEVGET